jgi:N-acetylated-alpha-linked acidic dipeptidase
MKAGRVLVIACACVLLAAAPPHTQIYGYTVANSDAEFALEDRFLDIPSSAGALEIATALASQPHYAGSAGDYKMALYVRDKFKEAGFDTTMETLTARIDVPKKLILEIGGAGGRVRNEPDIPAYTSIAKRRIIREQRAAVAAAAAKLAAAEGPAPSASPSPKVPYVVAVGLDLREIPDPNDPDTANPAVGLPFIAGSADGDVRAPLVYVGHGMPADYALLTGHNVDAKGAIVLIRLGSDSRGGLVRRAQAHGAVGAVLYDDPLDDGASRGPVDPNGPWRPLNSVQRGSVGEGVTIPVIPVSAANARLLLGTLKGPSGPRPWAGGMAVPYAFGRSALMIHMEVEMVRKITTLWNTVGILHGSIPGQELVLGAQRDAWVYGIGAGGGGTITLLETARGLGYLAHTGWVPGRTIVLAAWDGEELGSYGSLAYLKLHGDEIRDTSIAYLNTEPSVTGGTFGADAVAAIAPTIADASQLVADPARPGGTIYDRYAFRTHGALPPIDRGSGGIDRVPFLFGAGTPSANATFSGPFGPYHSSYDTLQFARTISDPQFDLHRAAAQLFGIAVLRLADADVVPYHFNAYVGPMNAALRNLAGLARTRHVNIDTRGFDASIRRFAANANRHDVATKRVATGNLSDRELEAARSLDLAAYGVDGDTGISFPDVVRAISEGDQNAVDLAVGRARQTIDRAGTLIGR